MPRTATAAAAAAVAGALTLAPSHALADDTVAAPDLKIHVPLTLGLGGLFWLGEAPFKGPLSADTCRWCGPILFDDGVRDALVWADRDRAHSISNLTGFIGAPLFAVGGIGLVARLDGRGGNWLDDGVIVVEASAFAGVLNFLVKAAVARERPFVHQLAPGDKPNTPHPQDNNQSFYSGHSTLSMSLAVSAGTVATMRGYRWAPALYGGGIALSLATGYLRIAADKHWASDVLTGWALGAAVGYAVPRLLHHKGSGRATSIEPLATGQTIGVALRW